MTEVAPAPGSPPKIPMQKKRTMGSPAQKVKKPVNHPPYADMIVSAIKELNDRKGSSRQAILKHVVSNFDVGTDIKVINAHLRMALKRAVASGALKQVKGAGAAGSFRIASEKSTTAEKKPKSSESPMKKATATVKKTKKSPKKMTKKPVAAESPAASPEPVPAAPSPKKSKAGPKKAKAKSPKQAVVPAKKPKMSSPKKKVVVSPKTKKPKSSGKKAATGKTGTKKSKTKAAPSSE